MCGLFKKYSYNCIDGFIPKGSSIATFDIANEAYTVCSYWLLEEQREDAICIKLLLY